MASKTSPAIIFFTCLVLPASVTFAFNLENSDYSQTVIRIDTGNTQKITNRIAEEIRKNDHTARLYSHSDHEKIFIIHHRSLSTKQLKSLIATLGISVESGTSKNNSTGIKPFRQEDQIYPLAARRTCGGTKTAWKKLLRKYFH